MTIRLAVLQHEAETGLGRFANLLDEHAVDYELVPSTRGTLPDPLAFDAAFVLGGSLAAHDATLLPARRWIRNVVLSDVPYLGVCLGAQLLASALGADVKRGRTEVGVHSVFLTDVAERDPLFGELARRFEVFGWHGDSFELPCGAVPLAGSLACTYQAFRYGANAYALQFHPEVRLDDLAGWRDVPGYRRLLEQTGRDWHDIAQELTRATAALDELAAHLLERWLDLVTRAAAGEAAGVGCAR
jgi:GMP synthase (glutamine-hydrolysing)